MQVIVKQARALVGHFKHSTTVIESLQAMCKALKMTFRTSKQDVAMRLGSTKIIVQPCLHLRPAFSGKQ